MNLESEQDVYARLLTRAEPKRGYPLWCPEPNTRLPPEYRCKGHRIGDVGVVTEHGSFDVFFNICLPITDPINTDGVPEGFKQIKLSERDIESFEPLDHRGRVVATQSITQTNLAVGTSGGGTSAVLPLQGGLGLQFNSSATEGAILVLPEGSDQHNLRNHLVFQKEALLKGKAWYEFALKKAGRTMISPDSMYLITGCHKTSSWSLAAFNNVGGSLNFNAQFTAGSVVNGNVTAAYTWQMTSAVPCRVGPDPYDGNKNQTVFIRGYKIAIRESIFLAHILGDVAISYQSPSSVSRKVYFTRRMKGLLGIERGDAGQTSEGDDAIVKERDQSPTDTSYTPELPSPDVHEDFGLADLTLDQAPFISKIYHPSDLINQIILDKESSCDIAVTHDDLWANILGELPSEKEHPDDISEAIKCECLKYSVLSFLGAAYFSPSPSPCSNTGPGLDGDGQKQYCNYSTEFLAKSQTSGGGENLDSTILCYKRALTQEAVHHPEFPYLLRLLSHAFYERSCQECNEPQDLKNAIHHLELALALQEGDYHEREPWLRSLATYCMRSYELSHTRQDLDDAVQCYEAALELPPYDNFRLSSLQGLGGALRKRFLDWGNDKDQDSANFYFSKAENLRSNPPPPMVPSPPELPQRSPDLRKLASTATDKPILNATRVELPTLRPSYPSTGLSLWEILKPHLGKARPRLSDAVETAKKDSKSSLPDTVELSHTSWRSQKEQTRKANYGSLSMRGLDGQEWLGESGEPQKEQKSDDLSGGIENIENTQEFPKSGLPDFTSLDIKLDDDLNTSLTSESLNPDDIPKRPMNAFTIFSRRRQSQISAENQSMRTGEINKILTREWNAMDPSEKQFYLDQAKQPKDTLSQKYPYPWHSGIGPEVDHVMMGMTGYDMGLYSSRPPAQPLSSSSTAHNPYQHVWNALPLLQYYSPVQRSLPPGSGMRKY